MSKKFSNKSVPFEIPNMYVVFIYMYNNGLSKWCSDAIVLKIVKYTYI